MSKIICTLVNVRSTNYIHIDFVIWKSSNITGHVLENVEHCGGESEQAGTGYYVTDG